MNLWKRKNKESLATLERPSGVAQQLTSYPRGGHLAQSAFCCIGRTFLFSKKRFSIVMAIVLTVMTLLSACGESDGGAVEAQPQGTAGYTSSVSQETPVESDTVVELEETIDSRSQQEEVTEEQSAPEDKVETTAERLEQTPDGTTQEDKENVQGELHEEAKVEISEDGWYTDKDSVALYIHLYQHLPDNYITKTKAEKLGWDSQKGNLDEVAPGKSIGGGKFGNREGLLPDEKGRTYYECDIDYNGGFRGGKRIVFSNDGLVYYSEDHYANFELLYTAEGPAE